MKSKILSYNIVLLVVVGLFGRGGSSTQDQDPICDPNSAAFPPAQGFNWNSLPNVKWYVQEIFYRSAEEVVEPGMSCYMHYILPPYGFSAQFVEQYTNLETGVATHNGSWAFFGYLDKDKPIWQVMTTYGIPSHKTVITHMDIPTGGVMHWCPYAEAPHHAYERVMTFSGVPEPDQALMDELRGAVESLGYPTNYSVRIQQGAAGCDYDPCEAVDEESGCCDPSVVNAPPMVDLELEKIQNKTWYVQEIYFREPTSFQASCFAQAFHESFWDGVLNYFKIFTDADGAQKYDLATGLYELDQLAVWEVHSDYSLNQFSSVLTHTDYDTFGVMHWCPKTENLDWKSEVVLTFTSSPNPDEALVLELREKVANGIGFPTGNGVRIDHHADCDYEYEYYDSAEEESKVEVNDDFNDS